MLEVTTPHPLVALINEAWRHARKRRAALALALSGAIFVALAVYVLVPGGSGRGGAPTAHSTHLGALVFAVPRGFNRYDVRGGLYRAGTRPPVIGFTLTDYRLKTHSPLRTKGVFPPSLYENRVAFQISLWFGIGPDPLAQLHLPLSLDQRWGRRDAAAGTRLVGFLSVQGREYEIFVWTGRKAPPRDRASLHHALTSIHPAQ